MFVTAIPEAAPRAGGGDSDARMRRQPPLRTRLLPSPTEGIQWGNAVIANVVWGGASLRCVLLNAAFPIRTPTIPTTPNSSPSAQASLSDCAPWPVRCTYTSSARRKALNPIRPLKSTSQPPFPLSTALHPNQHCLLAYEYNRTHAHTAAWCTSASGCPRPCRCTVGEMAQRVESE